VGITDDGVRDGWALIGLSSSNRAISRAAHIAIMPMQGKVDFVIGTRVWLDGMLVFEGPERRWSWDLINRRDWTSLSAARPPT
jgi:lipid-binding SYLF domain-containing protein